MKSLETRIHLAFEIIDDVWDRASAAQAENNEAYLRDVAAGGGLDILTREAEFLDGSLRSVRVVLPLERAVRVLIALDCDGRTAEGQLLVEGLRPDETFDTPEVAALLADVLDIAEQIGVDVLIA